VARALKIQAAITDIDVFEHGYAMVRAVDTAGHALVFHFGVELKDNTYPVEEQNTLSGELPYKVGDTVTVTVG